VTSLVSRDAFRHDRRREFSSAPLAGVKPIRDFASYNQRCNSRPGASRLNADNAMDSTARFGSDHGALRSEDEPLLTGGGRFTDDLNVPGQAYGVFVRAQVSHAAIRAVDTAAARAPARAAWVIMLAIIQARLNSMMPMVREKNNKTIMPNSMRP